MFCKASVLKCPGLKKKKAAYTVLLAVLSFSYNGNPQVHFVPPPPPSPLTPKKDNVACWLKPGAKCTKTLIS